MLLFAFYKQPQIIDHLNYPVIVLDFNISLFTYHKLVEPLIPLNPSKKLIISLFFILLQLNFSYISNIL